MFNNVIFSMHETLTSVLKTSCVFNSYNKLVDSPFGDVVYFTAQKRCDIHIRLLSTLH
jgi:hypothetical protein